MDTGTAAASSPPTGGNKQQAGGGGRRRWRRKGQPAATSQQQQQQQQSAHGGANNKQPTDRTHTEQQVGGQGGEGASAVSSSPHAGGGVAGGQAAVAPLSRNQRRRQKARQQQQQQQPQPSSSPLAPTAGDASAASPSVAPAKGGRRGRGAAKQQKQGQQQQAQQAENKEGAANGQTQQQQQQTRAGKNRRQRQKGSPPAQQQQQQQQTQSQPAGASASHGSVSEIDRLKQQVADLQRELEAEKNRQMQLQQQAARDAITPATVMPFASNTASAFAAPAAFPAATPGLTAPLSAGSLPSVSPPFSGAPSLLFTPFLPRPPEMVPFVPAVAPLDPLDIEPVNSGASSHSDTDSEYDREEEEEEEEEEGGEEEDEEEEEEDEEEDDESEHDDDSEEDEEEEEESDSHPSDLEHESSSSAHDRDAAAIMDEAIEPQQKEDGLTSKERAWLAKFKKEMQQQQQQHPPSRRSRWRSRRHGPSSSVSRVQQHCASLPAEVVESQLEVERQVLAQIEALSKTPLQSSPIPPHFDMQPLNSPPHVALPAPVPLHPSATLMLPHAAPPPALSHSAVLQTYTRAYILSIKQQAYATRKRIERQVYNYTHGIEDEHDVEEEEEEEDGEGESAEEEQEEDAEEDDDSEEDGEDAESSEEEDGLRKFVKAQFKKRSKRKTPSTEQEEEGVDEGDLTVEDVEGEMSQLRVSSAPSASSPLTIAPLIPVVGTAEEAQRASHSQANSPTQIAHHRPAHKHHARQSRARQQQRREEEEEEEEQGEEDSQLNESHLAPEEDGLEADLEEEEEVESDMLEEGTPLRSRSVSPTGSAGSDSGWEDRFPYEKNLFSLCPSYHFIRRLYTCDDAVTYKAVSKLTNRLVAIKVCDGYDGKVVPKEVRLLNSAQGHTNVCVMSGWHPFPNNHCYAIITEFIENEPLESIFDQLPMHKVYMRDMLLGLQHLHSRNILFRDIKPSNCLWSAKLQKAIIIDFDVGSYFDPVQLHRSMVGTDGYMAPEQMLIKHAKRKKLPLPYTGYGQEVDVYAAGMCLGQLLFGVSEDDVADLDNRSAKGESFLARTLDLAARGQATLGHHLLMQMINPEPKQRCTVKQALAHPWFKI